MGQQWTSISRSSRRRRRHYLPGIEPIEPRRLLTQTPTLLVTTVADSGAGSLRQAILDANATAGSDLININFDIEGGGVQTIIAPASPLPTITHPVAIDGYSQPGASPNTLAEGDNAQLKIVLYGIDAGVGANGLDITSGKSIVSGLEIEKFSGAGIRCAGTGNNGITGDFIFGPIVSGATSGLGGVLIEEQSNGNTIGGTVVAARNVISGYGYEGVGYGVEIDSSDQNVVAGNYIGTDPSGTTVMANYYGVQLQDFDTSNTIGGTGDGYRNVISGNFIGVHISNLSSYDVVAGNYIGTDASGTRSLGNSIGMLIEESMSNTIGGTVAAARNVISGNMYFGVDFTNDLPPFGNNVVEGNYIGTDMTGTMGLGNTVGVEINEAVDNTIGGTDAGAGNVISGNTNVGIEIEGFNSTEMMMNKGNHLLGNYIGVTKSGNARLQNLIGIKVDDVPYNTIGGTADGDRNIITGNLVGVSISGRDAVGNQVMGNYIGLGADGKTTFPPMQKGKNATPQTGVFIQDVSMTMVGGTGGARNFIYGNDVGVYILGQAGSANGNLVQGNRIMRNRRYGILLYNAPQNNVKSTGPLANKIHGSGIAPIREFTGPVTTTGSSGPMKSSRHGQAKKTAVHGH
jgi:titin